MVTTVEWYGCSTFRLATGDLTVFLDAYIDRAPGAAGGGRSADDVAVCDWIVVGHSHFDHLYGAERPGHSDRGDGGALVFVFDTPEGTLLFQDTSGHWSGVLDGLTVDVAILAATGRANRDGEPTQGSLADFVADEARVLGARRVLLGHHDDWLPGFSVDTDMTPIRAALAARAPGVELLEPGYLEPTRVFDGLA